jgi:hypothetical protein
MQRSRLSFAVWRLMVAVVAIALSCVLYHRPLSEPPTGRRRDTRGFWLRCTVWRMMVAVAVIALCCELLREFAEEDTVYAKGYSESRFLSLRVGMTKRQVETAMGMPPIRKDFTSFSSPSTWVDGGDVQVWQYSESPSDGDYERRWVFFRNGMVDRIDCRFYTH